MTDVTPARPATNSGGGGGLFALIFIGLLVFGGGCAAKDQFSSHDTNVTNQDGSSTYTSTFTDGSASGSTSCTTSADYSTTDCTSTP